jgi:hypothetical protein
MHCRGISVDGETFGRAAVEHGQQDNIAEGLHALLDLGTDNHPAEYTRLDTALAEMVRNAKRINDGHIFFLFNML